MAVTDIDYDILIKWLLPVRLRNPRLIAWMKVLCYPIKGYLYELFKRYESVFWYDINHQSGQVAYLEYVVNNLMGYDPATPMIKIGLGKYYGRWYLSMRAEEDPTYLGTKYVNRRADIYGEYDFKVIIEYSLEGTIDLSRVRAIIDRYKRDSKKYIIIYEDF